MKEEEIFSGSVERRKSTKGEWKRKRTVLAETRRERKLFFTVTTIPDRGSGIHAPMDMQRRQNIMQRSLLSSLRSSISP